MWKKAKPLLIILSVALNVAFVAVWATRAAPEWFARADEPVWSPLHRSLRVSTDQWRQVEARLLEFQKARQETCRRICREREEMLGLIVSPNPDREAIRARQEAILAGQRKMQNLLIEHLLDEKKLLSADQRKEFCDAIKRCMRRRCPGHGPMRCRGRGRRMPGR